MAKVDFDLVKKLRQSTGAGVNLCKEAVAASDGDMEKSIKYIRKKGAGKSIRRAGKKTSEGVIGVYVHGVDHKTAALVELNCETDFVARNKDFQCLAHELAMQVAAMDPKYVDRSAVPDKVLESELRVIKESDDVKGKPKDLLEKVVEGKLGKFFQENCLMDQKYFKNEEMTVRDLIDEAVAKIGEKIVVSRIYRIVVGG